MESEKTTRQELIDKQLALASWNVDDRTQVIEEFAVPVSSNAVQESAPAYGTTQFSDYALLGKDGKPLAVVEAKKSSIDAEIGREQAKQYCYHIQEKTGFLPFCFYTNGLETYFWDLERYPPRKVVGYPNRDDLERFKFLREHGKPLTDELINTSIAGRDYQIRAIRSVLEAIDRKQRDFLLVMATGTGKTRTCIALVDALMRAGRAERVLFLVDRIALREQALAAFKEHLPNEPRWPNVGEKLIAKNRRIYVSTYPSMLNVIRSEDNPLSPHFFDLIVVDESHRSIYNTFGEILNYFKTITLGLTATPTDVIDHNTFQLFECEDGLPTFAYTYEEAVNNDPPYLSDFQVMKIQTRFQMEGISKRTISLADQKKLILDGKEVAEINFEGTELEKTVTNQGTNALIVKEFMEECIKDGNRIEELCTGTITPVQYADIAMFHEKLSELLKSFCENLYNQVFSKAAFKNTYGNLNQYYNEFVKENDEGKCPFCGLEDIKSELLATRDAFDHYFPKSKVPFNSVNFSNLAVACGTCNEDYKKAKIPALKGDGSPRKAFYPFSTSKPEFDIEVQIETIDPLNHKNNKLNIQIVSADDRQDEVDTWTDLYGIKSRYADKCSSRDSLYWLQHFDELENYDQDINEYLPKYLKNKKKHPLREYNFLRVPFILGCIAKGIPIA